MTRTVNLKLQVPSNRKLIIRVTLKLNNRGSVQLIFCQVVRYKQMTSLNIDCTRLDIAFRTRQDSLRGNGQVQGVIRSDQEPNTCDIHVVMCKNRIKNLEKNLRVL